MLSLDEAKTELTNLIAKVSPKDLPTLAEFLSDCADSIPSTSSKRINGLKQLKNIAERLRKKVGINGEVADENIIFPSDGEFKESTADSIVDSFLYDDLDLRELQAKSLVRPEKFCADCKSTNIKETVYNSHSLSINDVDWIFNELLPQFIDLTGKRLVDIGSRLGVVLYAAALFRPEIETVYGIEINEEFCAIQEETLKKLKNADKCHVVKGDFVENLEPLKNADVTIMNNVFTFFADHKTQVKCWKILQETLSKDSFLVHAHSVESVTGHLKLDFNVSDWLETIYPTKKRKCKDEEFDEIYLYRIQMKRGQTSRAVSTKKLTISEYRRRLKDNVRSLGENLSRMMLAAKITADDSSLKTNSIALMADKFTLCNELCSRTALMTRAADDLLKLTNDIREFLILRDFNFTNQTMEKAEEEMQVGTKRMGKMYDELRLDLTTTSIDLDRELADNFGLKQ